MSGPEGSSPAPLGAPSHAALVSSLLDELSRAGVTEAEVSFGGLRVVLRRRSGRATLPRVTFDEDEQAAALREGWVAVTAPLAGVYYNRESPEAEVFARVGGMVHAGQTVGLIESMKMFNEVTCDVQGIVRDILVANGDVVQAAQALLYVEPSDGPPEGPPAV